MRLAVLTETRPGEARVAATPESVKKLIGLGLDVSVQAGAGLHASIPDSEYASAGATLAPDARSVLEGAGIVFSVQAPAPAERALLGRGALLACIAGAFADPSVVADMAQAGVDLAAMEMLPRITRAQSMDVLSSQANLAGYRAVIEGAGAFDRGFPMMMTAAGTVPPARVFVMGAGVAGLQAIATARRLGAIVSATDVRPAAKEEIRSLGATFVGVEDEESAKQTGAYAGQMSEAFRAKQAELVASTVAKQDLVICTALVMGRRAPVLVTKAMVAAMKPGSVVVDLASDAGGNCEATVPGEVFVSENGVKVLGFRNWPARIPVAASALYSRNLLTFLTTFWDKDAGRPKLPEDDDIVRGVLLTRGGAIVAEAFRDAKPSAGAEATQAPAAASPGEPAGEGPAAAQAGPAVVPADGSAPVPAEAATASAPPAAPSAQAPGAPMAPAAPSAPAGAPSGGAVHPEAARAEPEPVAGVPEAVDFTPPGTQPAAMSDGPQGGTREPAPVATEPGAIDFTPPGEAAGRDARSQT